jgi:hypothetical protein
LMHQSDTDGERRAQAKNTPAEAHGGGV